MLEIFGARFESTLLNARFDMVKERLESDPAAAIPISLLPGFSFPELNKTWNIQLP